jgi:hypothetical protein
MFSSRSIKVTKKDWLDVAVLTLLAANGVPLFGFLFLGWGAFYIVLLYWAENVVIGFYNVLKMAFATASHPAAYVGKLFLIPFFVVHYGGFTAVLLVADKAINVIGYLASEKRDCPQPLQQQQNLYS